MTRVVFIDSTPCDPTSQANGAYLRPHLAQPRHAADDGVQVVARGTENVEIEIARGEAVFSLLGHGRNAGVWVAPLPLTPRPRGRFRAPKNDRWHANDGKPGSARDLLAVVDAAVLLI